MAMIVVVIKDQINLSIVSYVFAKIQDYTKNVLYVFKSQVVVNLQILAIRQCMIPHQMNISDSKNE